MPRDLASGLRWGEEQEQDIPTAFDLDVVLLRHLGSAVLIYFSSLGKSKKAEVVSQLIVNGLVGKHACLALRRYLMPDSASLPAPALSVPAHGQCQFPYLLGNAESIYANTSRSCLNVPQITLYMSPNVSSSSFIRESL